LPDYGERVARPSLYPGEIAGLFRRKSMTAIELDAVSKTFADRVVLKELSLQVEYAERLVLFGPSGCGKTTILRLIAGLEIPDNGAIRIDGRLVAQIGKNLVPPEHRNLGMVFQDLALWPHMTVRGNLMFGLESRGIPKREAEARIQDVLRQVGLESRADAKPHQLSGGEQQRVALGRALVMRPSTLLMDEPLSSLDEERKQTIMSDLLGLQKQLSFTLIYVTHDRSEAQTIASRICHIHNGRIEKDSR
jgi:ABC-type sugar transport system ATPase subunit